MSKYVPNSALIYQDYSLAVPNEEVSLIITGLNGNSNNSKTGRMAQLYLLCSQKPSDAIRNGIDKAVCGHCSLRNSKDNNGINCYVNTHHLQRTWYALKGNRYQHMSLWQVRDILLANKTPLRVTAYGDMALIASGYDILDTLTSSTQFTGYTHQHNEQFFDHRLATKLMLSVDSLAHKLETQKRFPNCRTYRILAKNEVKQNDEILCPSKKIPLPHGGFRRNIQCQTCLLCNAYSKFNIATMPLPAPLSRVK